VPAIEVTFVEECRGELARVAGIGYRGSGDRFAVELCVSHFDARGNRLPEVGGPIDVELVAFVAKHTFGHALGLEHQYYERDVPRLMAEALDLLSYDEVPFQNEHAAHLQHLYGNKPPGSLVGANGRCIAESAGALDFASCDGAAASLFRSTASGVENAATGSCLQANGSSVTLVACEGDERREGFRLARVRWLASEGRCVTVGQPPASTGSPLVVGACDPTWAPAGLFGIERAEDGRVRIRAAGGSCVAWPATWSSASVPELGTCGGPRDTFDASFGHLSVDGRCLTVIGGRVELRPCLEYNDQRFASSGPIELGGLALTLSGSAQPTLELGPLSFPPEPSQIFDWYL
jgi:hypothetical protein